MKKIWTICAAFLLLQSVYAQQTPPDCLDYLYLKNGSVFRGTILEYKEGEQVRFRTWNNLEMEFSETNVRKIVQRCKETPGAPSAPQPKVYNFNEKGWYHATRLTFLPGLSYFQDATIGLALHHSSGYMFQRRLGLGLGVGVEVFEPGNDAASYPVYAELRGYLLPKRITPFYAVGAGYGFTSRSGTNSGWYSSERYHGGWMAQAQIGYRFGNHFTIHTGVHFQQKTRQWERVWSNESGVDRILNRRMEIGVGLLF